MDCEKQTNMTTILEAQYQKIKPLLQDMIVVPIAELTSTEQKILNSYYANKPLVDYTMKRNNQGWCLPD